VGVSARRPTRFFARWLHEDPEACLTAFEAVFFSKLIRPGWPVCEISSRLNIAETIEDVMTQGKGSKLPSQSKQGMVLAPALVERHHNRHVIAQHQNTFVSAKW